MPPHPADSLIHAIAEAVAARLNDRTPEIRPRLLDLDGAALYLSMTPDAIRHKVSNGQLAAVRIDRHLRFDVQDLDRIIEGAKS